MEGEEGDPCIQIYLHKSRLSCMTQAPTTTVRIPIDLRRQLAEQARSRQSTMASVIETALTALIEEEFWRRMNETMPQSAEHIDQDSQVWDATLADGLVEEDWSWIT